jgi:DsbC/DsbD-like thiol-disulfide interchange protein
MILILPLLLALIGPHVASVAPQDDDSQADGNKLVKVSLLAERAEIQPGSTFTIAVKCKVERRWHVYWGENAGEAGLPIAAPITGPPGYVIGPLRHPWPKREALEGDIVEYILDGEFAMLADVTVPADAKPGSQAAFEVKARWLVCTTICVQGAANASMTLPVAEKEKPANEADFKNWRTRLPRPWSEVTRTMATWSGDERAPKLTLVVPGATAIEFFPYKSATTDMKSRKVDVGKQGSTLALEYEFSSKQAGDVPTARGVVWIKTEKGEAAYVLDQPYKKA